jgi:putative membrane protein
VTNLLLRLLVSTGAVLLAQYLFRDYVQVGGTGETLLLNAGIFAVVLGVLNVLIRPILRLLTCPINLLTLGLFVFVVNAAVFWLATWLWPGVAVNGFLGALLGSLVVSVCSTVANWFLE